LSVYAGVVVFNNPVYDALIPVDIPFTINRQQLEFFKPDSADPHFYGRVFAQVTLFSVDGLPVDSNSTYFSVRAVSSLEAASTEFTLFNRIRLLVKPGIYSARLTVIDAVSKREGEFFLEKILVTQGRRDRLTIGGVCLAYRITYVGENSDADRMVVNGFEVLVNPLRVFSYTDTVFYLYAELYNLSFLGNDSSLYRLAYTVLDNAGTVFRDFGYKLQEKPGSTAVVAEVFDLDGWPAGQYRLRMIASDLDTEVSDTAFIDLRIVRQPRLTYALNKSLIADPYDTLSLEVRERLVAYLLTPDQKLTFSRLSPVGRENFLEQFWEEHDVNPETRIIENRLEMIERFDYCNHLFSYNTTRTNGWSTDRGRIYMKYGPWDDRDDISTPVVGNPFVIWYYHTVREGAVFVFEDKQGFHDYTLVHSNVEGERFSREWEERLRQQLYKLY